MSFVDRLREGMVSRPEGDAATREVRIARAITILASVWFAAVAAWDMFGPVLGGHWASNASMGIIAENMQRWGIAGPVWAYSDTKPTPDLYYCHHPWGIFWSTRVALSIFGRHDFVCRVAAVVLSAATPPLLSSTAKALFRPYAGAAAAVGFAVLPITLSFANFNALEVPVIAHSTLMLWGYVKLRASGKRRHLAASVIGAVLAMNADWPAFVLVGALLGVDLVALLFGRWSGGERRNRVHVRWWLLVASSAAATLLLYAMVFRSAGKLADLFAAYGQRSSGNEAPLREVLASRRYWIQLSFTPIAIFVGKAYVFVALARFALVRRSLELVPLAVLAMAIVQYVVFRQGADIHVFWPHYFGQYFAFACAGFVATIAPLVELAVDRFAPKLRTFGGEAAILLVLLPLGLVARDGVVALKYARGTGGRFNEKGLRIESEGDRIALLEWLAPKPEKISTHTTLSLDWASIWALGGRTVVTTPGPPRSGSSDLVVADSRFLGDGMKSTWLHTYGVTTVGPYWIVAAAQKPPEALGFAETEPSVYEWMFVAATEPHRDVVPDAWVTWELRSHYGFDPGPLPTSASRLPGPARELDEHRIRHDAAVLDDDRATAARELAAMDALCEPLDAAFDDGTRIRCVAFHDGAAPSFTIVFEPSGPLASSVEMRVTSRVTARMALSTTMTDPLVKEHSYPFTLAPTRFKRGLLYSHEVRVRKRPGTEVFEASFRGAGAPTRRDAVRLRVWD